ncbi:AhpC/TSA family protein [compost metagenome]
MFVYFNSECEFCNHEAEMIKENIVAFKDIQIVFISFEKPDGIKSFAQKHKLLNYDDIHFIHDIKADFAATFDVKSLPSIVLYDKNQKLIERFKGQVKAETILKKLDGK